MISALYPSIDASDMLYEISCPTLPSSYFGKLVQLHDHPSASVTVLESFTCPSASKLIVISVGLLLSWLFASVQVFVPSTSTVSGVCVFVTVISVV